MKDDCIPRDEEMSSWAKTRGGSTASPLMRHWHIGYNTALRILDVMRGCQQSEKIIKIRKG